jgi:predicted transcriptional regulator
MLDTDALSKEDIQVKLGKSGKITSTRLGELVKNNLVTKTVDDRFRISTFGVVQAQKEILPRVRAKVSGA